MSDDYDDEVELALARNDDWRELLEENKSQLKSSNKPLIQPMTSTPRGGAARRMPMRQHISMGNMPLLDWLRDISPVNLEPGTVVRWVSQSQAASNSYTYAGVWTGEFWFITGTGQYYNGNQFTWNTFITHVLEHHDVRSINISSEWVQ